jgi:hypothetical protein
VGVHRRYRAAAGGVGAALLLTGTLAAPAHAAPVPGASVVTIVPVRVLTETALPPETVRCVSVAGANGIPANAPGVVANVTAVRPNGVGYAVVFPDTRGNGSTPMPATSTVNFEPGQDVASSTFVQLGPNGDLCYATRGASSTGLLIDVSGYMEAGSGVVVDSPQRLIDTRRPVDGGPVLPRTPRKVQVTGLLGVPADAESAILNVTVTGVTSVGNLRVYPGGEVSDTSVVNYVPGVDKANTTVVPLADDGSVTLYSDSDRPVQAVVDVLGYTEPGGSYVPVTPTRVLDSREDPEPFEGGFVYSIEVDEVAPANATALVLNVTAIHPDTVGNLRVYPGDPNQGDPPNASSINYIPGRDIPNLVVVGLPAERFIDVFSDQPDGGTVDLAFDFVGYVTD